MADAREELMSCMAMVDKVALLGHLAHHGLQNDAVQPHALQPALPPVGLRFQDFGELRFRYAVTLTRFYKDLAADATVAQNAGHPPRQSLTAAKSPPSNRDNRHRFSLPQHGIFGRSLAG